MNVLYCAMSIVGIAFIGAAFVDLWRRVDRLTHHVNRLIESEDQPPRRVNLSIGEGVLRNVVRRELLLSERRQQQERN